MSGDIEEEQGMGQGSGPTQPLTMRVPGAGRDRKPACLPPVPGHRPPWTVTPVDRSRSDTCPCAVALPLPPCPPHRGPWAMGRAIPGHDR